MVSVWTGQEVAALRCAMRLSIRGFAERLGVSDRMVSRWEAAGRGIRPRPFTQSLLDTAVRLADDETRERFVVLLTLSSPEGGGRGRLG